MTIDLDHIQIATPCDASWDDMVGDERARRCQACKLDVLNIAALTREEAVDLIQARAGERTCLRLHRRHDDTVITADCPVGQRRVRDRRNRLRAMCAGTFALLISVAFAVLGPFGRDRGSSGRVTVNRILDKASHTLGMPSLCKCSPVLGAYVGPLTPNGPISPLVDDEP